MDKKALDHAVVTTGSENGLYKEKSIDISKIKSEEDIKEINKLSQNTSSISFQIDDMEQCAKYFLQDMSISSALKEESNSITLLSAQLLTNIDRLRHSLVENETNNIAYYALICGQLFQKINFIHLWEPAAIAKKKNTDINRINSENNAKASRRFEKTIEAHELADHYLLNKKTKSQIVSFISKKMNLSSRTIRRYLESHPSKLWASKKK